MHKLAGVRGDAKGNLMSRVFSVGSFNQTAKYSNPEQNGIHKHIAARNSTFQDGVSVLIGCAVQEVYVVDVTAK